jgi:hypothetical protein
LADSAERALNVAEMGGIEDSGADGVVEENV